jgi:hypothetical protein
MLASEEPREGNALTRGSGMGAGSGGSTLP